MFSAVFCYTMQTSKKMFTEEQVAAMVEDVKRKAAEDTKKKVRDVLCS